MKIRFVLTFLIFLGFGAIMLPRPAAACCKCSNWVPNQIEREWYSKRNPTLPRTIKYIENEFTSHKQWLVGVVWEDNILPAMMMMTDELINVGMKQVEIFGNFLDAKHQLETQQAMQVERAQIHKDYLPSNGMCELGTSMKSLVASERRAEINNVILSQRAQDRHLGNAYSSSFTGRDTDKASRLAQFKNQYCSKRDNKNGMSDLCSGGALITAPERKNRDIDFVRLMDSPWTLNLNLTDGTLTHHETDIFSLASTLYGHDTLRRPLAKAIRDRAGRSVSDVQEYYMEARSLMAKRSVAENAFNAIASAKASGTGGSREYLVNILADLGVPKAEGMNLENILQNEAGQILGDDPDDPASLNPLSRPNPSYHAQMEVLTKKLFQNPQFYTNLYDKPANVARKGVALQAIGLMQKFDVFKSYLRNEAMASVLLEMAVMEMQEEIENEFGGQGVSGN